MTKYYYFFRPNLKFGVHFFEAWVNAVKKNGIEMKLITSLPFSQYTKQYNEVKYYRKTGIIILLDLPYGLVYKTYFLFQLLFFKRVIVHLKKRQTKYFDFLKKVFPRKIKYIYEGEGDPITEYDYLKKHPYKLNFYNYKSILNNAKEQKSVLKNADIISFGYRAMKNMLIERYPDLNLEKKICLVPMTFNKGRMFFSESIRIKKRKELKLQEKQILIYTGNAYYSWQNVFRTLELFKYLKDNKYSNLFIILLIKNSDQYIVKEFIHRLEIRKSDFLLKQVPHDKVPKYLNAADMGVALRHNHVLNSTTPSGKILEYLGCGLPVLTTQYMGEVSKLINQNNFGIVLKNMDNNNELLSQFDNYIKYDKNARKKISEWANENLSIESKIDEYIKKLKYL